MPSVGGGGAEPGWAVQLLSTRRVMEDSSNPCNEKSLEPVNWVVSPLFTSPENSNSSRLLSFCIKVYLNVTVASRLDETHALPDHSPEILDSDNKETVVQRPTS